jgi:transcriptional regulator with XRE-family HTH domain
MRTEKKDLNIQIGKRLQDIRENCGYTQEAFAEKLDVGVEHYRKIESGAYGVQPEKLFKLYKAYSIDPTYLITGVKNQQFNIDVFLANCSREQRNEFIQKVLMYMSNLMKSH